MSIQFTNCIEDKCNFYEEKCIVKELMRRHLNADTIPSP